VTSYPFNVCGIDCPLRPWVMVARAFSGNVELTVDDTGTIDLRGKSTTATINPVTASDREWKIDPTGQVWEANLDALRPLMSAVDDGLLSLADEADKAGDRSEGPLVSVFFGDDAVCVVLWFNGYVDTRIEITVPATRRSK
jgi:hypothetical protein